MVFRRRDKLSWWRFFAEGVWPRSGWPRALSYFRHRIRRLPDTPHKVARGMFAGTLISVLPLPGLQMVTGALLAWVMRGNILAAILATFISNPLTTPVIAVASIGLGQWMLGEERVLSARQIGRAFAEAGNDLWHNLRAIFTSDVASWIGLGHFWKSVYLPYLVGAMVIGVLAALAAYYVTIPLVTAYQRARTKRLRDRADDPQSAHRAPRGSVDRNADGKTDGKADGNDD